MREAIRVLKAQYLLMVILLIFLCQIIFYCIIMFLENETEYCVYGKCFYCQISESVCGDQSHQIEGVILHLIPGTLVKYRSPWQRTYKDNQKAEWEENMNYCT